MKIGYSQGCSGDFEVHAPRLRNGVRMQAHTPYYCTIVSMVREGAMLLHPTHKG